MIGKTMKCLVAVVAIMMMTLGGVTAQTWTSGECTVTLENGVLTVSGNGSMAHYINESSVIPWYDSREQVTSIVVSNGVTNIGVRAFIGCSNATTVSLPNTLTSIGLMAFLGCTGLTDITLPNSLTSIQESAFMDCTGLTSITLPNSVTTIKEGLFEGCTGLTTVTLPSSVTKIEERAFYNCSAVTDVYLAANPANLTWENEWYGSVYNDFKENGTTLCHVPSQYYEAYVANFSHINVIFVEEGQMSWQSGDCTVTLENGVLTVSGNGAMADYTWDDEASSANNPWRSIRRAVTSIVVEDGVTHIGEYALVGCTYATSVTLPNSVTTIGKYAFDACMGFTSVTLPNSLTSIEEATFAYCNSLVSVTMPNSVTTIGTFAFYGCESLVSVTMSNSLTTIGPKAFYECANLISVALPNTLTSIGEFAFYKCENLVSVTLPNSVTTIERFTFGSCYSLTSLVLPNSLTTIGEAAFNACDNLTNVTLPGTLTAIGGGAFYGCRLVTDVFLSADPANLTWSNEYNGTVYNDFKANKATQCHVPSQYLAAYEQKFPQINLTFVSESQQNNLSWQSGDCTVTLENGVMTVTGNGDMANYTWDDETSSTDAPWWSIRYAVTSIVVEEGVIYIGKEAFDGCYNVTSVTLPNSLTTIGIYAFQDITGLTSITLPNSLTTLGESAFFRCTGLTSITLPESLTTIGSGTFEACTGLTSVTLPNSLTTIGAGAFYRCTGLTSITLPSSVSTIEPVAFYLCTSMTDIYFSADPANLTWTNEYYGTAYNDFKANKATQCHVPGQYLADYQQNFSQINVTFVGDYEPENQGGNQGGNEGGNTTPEGQRKLKGIPTGWTVTADGQPVEVNVSGEAQIQVGAKVVVTPTDRDKPRVKNVSIVPSN